MNFYPSVDELKRIIKGTQKHYLAVAGKEIFSANINETLLCREEHFINKDGTIIYKVDAKGSQELLSFKHALFLPNDKVRYKFKVVNIIEIAYNDLDKNSAKLTNKKTVYDLKKEFIKKLPRQLRAEYGPKNNPKLKFLELEKEE